MDPNVSRYLVVIATNRVRSKRRRSDSGLSLREVVHMEQQEERDKNLCKCRRNEAGWEDIDPNEAKWLPIDLRAVTPGARLRKVSRKSRISDVYLSLLPPAVLNKSRNELGSHKIVYNHVPINLETIYEMYAISLRLRAELWKPQTYAGKNIIRTVYKHVREVFPDAMGYNKFTWLRNNYFVTTEVARWQLSKIMRKHIAFGEFVAMDEKQKGWRGGSAHIKKIPSKNNNPIGHWNTQACVRLDSGEPFVFGIYPFSSKKHNLTLWSKEQGYGNGFSTSSVI